MPYVFGPVWLRCLHFHFVFIVGKVIKEIHPKYLADPDESTRIVSHTPLICVCVCVCAPVCVHVIYTLVIPRRRDLFFSISLDFHYRSLVWGFTGPNCRDTMFLHTSSTSSCCRAIEPILYRHRHIPQVKNKTQTKSRMTFERQKQSTHAHSRQRNKTELTHKHHGAPCQW